MKVCPDCKKEISKSAKVCPNCGKKQGKPKWVIVLIVIFAIIVIVGIGGNSENDSDNNGTFERNKKNQVNVIDFSNKTEAEIVNWCTINKINCKIENDYSDIIEKEKFVSQSVETDKTIYEGDKITIIFSLGKEPTIGQKNALKKAKSYLSHSAFSYDGLIHQLEFEGYSNEEAVYAVDNCGADWNEQAAKKAKSYLSHSSFSRAGLIKQLEFEKFTHEQAVYGVEQNGY